MTLFQVCKDCVKRSKNCHSNCIDYSTEKALNALQNLKERKEKEAQATKFEGVERRVYKSCGRKSGRNT